VVMWPAIPASTAAARKVAATTSAVTAFVPLRSGKSQRGCRWLRHRCCKRLEDRKRQRGVAVPAAFACGDAQDALLTVDSADLEPDRFADAETAAIHHQKAGAVGRAPYAGKQSANLIVAKRLGKTFLLRQPNTVF